MELDFFHATYLHLQDFQLDVINNYIDNSRILPLKRKTFHSPTNVLTNSIPEDLFIPQSKKYLSCAYLTLKPKAYKLVKDCAIRKVKRFKSDPEVMDGFALDPFFVKDDQFCSDVAMVTFLRKVSMNDSKYITEDETYESNICISDIAQNFKDEMTLFNDDDDIQSFEQSLNMPVNDCFVDKTWEQHFQNCPPHNLDNISSIDNELYRQKIIFSSHVEYSSHSSFNISKIGGNYYKNDTPEHNKNHTSEGITEKLDFLASDKCVSLMRQSRGSCENAERAKLKPVLSRMNKFLSHEDVMDHHGNNKINERELQTYIDEDEEMSFRSHDSASLRNIIHSSSFKSSETPKASIKDRLSALQDSGEQGWRKRLARNNVIAASSPCLASPSSPSAMRKKPVIISVSNDITNKNMTSSLTEGNLTAPIQKMNQSASTECVVRHSNQESSPSIAGRLSLLVEAQGRWTERREKQDADKFTVAGKMRRMGVEGGESPLLVTKRPSIRPTSTIEINRIAPDFVENKVKDSSQPKVIKIPKMDEDQLFEQSFGRIGDQEAKNDEIYFGDINNLGIGCSDMLPFVRKIRPRRNNRGSANPLKTRSLVIEVSDEYLEVRTGVTEIEKKRLEKERIVGQPHLAQEALAGLACKENFDQVALRKSGSFRSSTDQHEPFKNFMLFQIKGRRICQTRLVDPSLNSFNSGDCFILVTPDVVYLFMGRFSNVIERAKALDLANQIVEKHDMGIKVTCQLIVIDEEKETRKIFKLWNMFSDANNFSVKDPGPSEEDEIFEASIISTNKVYRLNEDDQLQFVNEYSGVTLQCSVLKSSECLVFDFGSEMYTWSGKNVISARRRKGLSLALDVWKKGFDYSDALINPIYPLTANSERTGSKRPDWCLFGKVSQNLETMLFKEKFIDWPDLGRIIKVKDQATDDSKSEVMLNLVPCDVNMMLSENMERSSLKLEDHHIGRGQKWEETVDGIKWEHEMLTSELDVWHISESIHSKIEHSNFGQFHAGDTYVIRWKYNINQITRNLKGEISKRDVTTGRNRCAYFFWQGSDSSITEKGASALMAMELNQDRGTHVRLVQGKEPSCFLGLFVSYPMFVYLGKRFEVSKTSAKSDVRFSKYEPSIHVKSTSKINRVPQHYKRLFLLRNELPEDSYFLEVVFDVANLRSRTSFLLVGSENGVLAQLTIWHGCKTSQHIRQRISELANILLRQCPVELGLMSKLEAYQEIEEGFEPPTFHDWFGGKIDREAYFSLLDDVRPMVHTPHLFHFTWTSGAFEADKIQNPASNELGVPSPFPFHQSDIYSISQPALFLLDNHHEVYLWQGWWASSSSECPNLHTGSASALFMNTKKCAMQTAINYCKAKTLSVLKCYLVHAGCEPPQFTSLFPAWHDCDDAIAYAKENNLKSLQKIFDVLKKLNKSMYTWSELQERPLPDGVDPLKLETYLDDEEFQSIMGMYRNSFLELPQWKRTNLKRDIGLF